MECVSAEMEWYIHGLTSMFSHLINYVMFMQVFHEPVNTYMGVSVPPNEGAEFNAGDEEGEVVDLSLRIPI